MLKFPSTKFPRMFLGAAVGAAVVVDQNRQAGEWDILKGAGAGAIAGLALPYVALGGAAGSLVGPYKSATGFLGHLGATAARGTIGAVAGGYFAPEDRKWAGIGIGAFAGSAGYNLLRTGLGKLGETGVEKLAPIVKEKFGKDFLPQMRKASKYGSIGLAGYGSYWGASKAMAILPSNRPSSANKYNLTWQDDDNR